MSQNVDKILRVIQRTSDKQGNVTMLRLAENIAAELAASGEAVEMARKADIAEARAEGAEAAIERARDVIDGWEQDGPSDPAIHLLIQRVRESLSGTK